MVSLPPLTAEQAAEVHGSFSAPVRRPVEPVGKHFFQHAHRILRQHTWSEFERIQAEQNVKNVEADNVDPDEELFDKELADETLLSHEARDWKTADLYAAMGLSKLRYRATPTQIIKAHRKQVLKYHPDKKSASGASLDEDNFFKIIQKAFETLTDPVKRRQYDSCDFEADVEPPKKSSKADFFEAWTPVFQAEARFSKKQPVPELGTMDSSREEVEKFYSFWHRFDSWRSFEFLDEEVPDDSSNRDHKRYIERKNIAARNKKKSADTLRLAKLVERAMAEDPRILKYKEEEKLEKERKKWEREAGARAEAEAKAKAEEEARIKAELDAKAAAEQKADKKKVKEAAKAAKKKNKRFIRAAPKEANYFNDPEAANAAKIDEQVSHIIDALDDEQLASLAADVKDASDLKAVFTKYATILAESSKLPKSLLSYFL